jgi:hypothetical protein
MVGTTDSGKSISFSTDAKIHRKIITDAIKWLL